MINGDGAIVVSVPDIHRGDRIDSQGPRIDSQGPRIDSQGPRIDSQGASPWARLLNPFGVIDALKGQYKLA